jgi:hypothetical protein
MNKRSKLEHTWAQTMCHVVWAPILPSLACTRLHQLSWALRGFSLTCIGRCEPALACVGSCVPNRVVVSSELALARLACVGFCEPNLVVSK